MSKCSGNVRTICGLAAAAAIIAASPARAEDAICRGAKPALDHWATYKRPRFSPIGISEVINRRAFDMLVSNVN
jgi:hypothetical protein